MTRNHESHTATILHPECSHLVCTECKPLTVNLSEVPDSDNVLIAIIGGRMPAVGAPAVLQDETGVEYVGHVTSTADGAVRQAFVHIHRAATTLDVERWLPRTIEEQAVIAHLRSIDHFGPACAICKAEA